MPSLVEKKQEAARAVAAQELAFHFLQAVPNAYKVLLRNYECALGEIHMIAKRDGMLVFIEVCINSFVTAERRVEIGKVALYYMKRYGIRADVPFRFDQVIVKIGGNKKPEIEVMTYAQGGAA